MRVLKMLAAASLVVAPVAAQAESAGVLSAPKGGVFVSRNGAVIAGSNGMVLRAGDRVMTRAGSTAAVSFGGCTTQVASASVLAVGGCGAQARNFTAAQDDRDGSTGNGAVETGGGIGADGVIVGVAAVVAAGLGIWAASDNSSRPNSP